MDLGIRGKKALVCGASKGLGRGCAHALAREGCAVTIVGRTAADIEKAAEEMQRLTGSTVTPNAISPFRTRAHSMPVSRTLRASSAQFATHTAARGPMA